MIELYHGSNVEINKIKFSLCKPNKDFGQGFYLTPIKSQAEQMAVRRVKISGEGTPIVNTFLFDENEIKGNVLKVLQFDKPTEKWAEFILSNRTSLKTGFKHDYDVVIGPVANDGVAFQLDRYQQHLISMDQLIKELSYRKLNIQYFFGTDLSISKLSKI